MSTVWEPVHSHAADNDIPYYLGAVVCAKCEALPFNCMLSAVAECEQGVSLGLCWSAQMSGGPTFCWFLSFSYVSIAAMPAGWSSEKMPSDWAGVLCWMNIQSLQGKICLASNSVMEGSSDTASPVTYICGESMRVNADCEGAGSAAKSADWRR